MVFRNIVFCAVIAGLVSGLVYGVFQQLQVAPIIHAAEEYEVSDHHSDPLQQTGEDQHDTHSHDAWSPSDGFSRTIATIGANILVGIAFALFLISLMAWHNHQSSKSNINFISGIGWGLALLISFFIAPAMMGLHPEVPGTIAANLENRQIWWVSCVVATAAGIACIYYGPIWVKIIGLVLLALPHIIGAPSTGPLAFANTDEDAVAALTALSQQFYRMTTVGMVLFFITLGATCGYFTRRLVKLDLAD